MERAISSTCVLFAIFATLCLSVSRASADDALRRVLILSAYNYTLPAATQVIDGIQKRFAEAKQCKSIIDAEFLDLVRVSDAAHEGRTATFLKEKYSGKPPDIVIVVGGTALQFIMRYRDIVAPQIPVVFSGVSRTTFSAVRPPNSITGILSELDLEKTVSLAERLQPRTRQLFVITGNSPVEDRRWQEAARRTLEPKRKFETTYLFGLPFDELMTTVSQIPSDSIVILLSHYIDGTGKYFVSQEVAKEVADASPAPVYGPYDTYIGKGVVGGFVETFESNGAAAADLALEILAGSDPTTIPPRVNPVQARVDARAMARWGLSQRDLPSGTDVLFYRPSLWEQHRWSISALFVIIIAQAAIVTVLVFQRRRRREAEKSLRESEDRMKFTAASVGVGLWQFNRTTDELWATENSRRMFGLGNDVALTRDAFLRAIHPEDRSVAVAALRGASIGRSDLTDVRTLHPDGQVRWIRDRARLHLDQNGAQDQLSGVFIDITDQKAAESEAELHRQEVAHLMRVSVLGELSGAIAHEVNQPLTAILSNAQAALYLLGQVSPNLVEVQNALNDIVEEDNRAGQVIQRLRGLLKKGEARSEPVDLNEMVATTTTLLRSELINRHVTVETDLEPDLATVVGDTVQLQQVLLNLVVNAMDAMSSVPDLQRVVHISTRYGQAGDVIVRVQDQGPGLKPAETGQAFVPFYTTKPHGLGLGLAICSTIIRKHGGTISLKNAVEGGAVAELALPARFMMMAAQ